MELVKDRVRPKATSLTLVDMAPEPRMVYTMLDALYDLETSHPEDVMDAIDYLEARLVDLDLPLTLEEYAQTIESPENTTWKRVNIFQTPEEV